jgi:hypothetical protein
MSSGGVSTLLSGILKVKLPESRQNLIKSSWRERYCVLEDTQQRVELKIWKSNAAKSTPKLYFTLCLSKESSVWKDSNTKSSIFYAREGGQEIAFSCSSPAECDQWVATLNRLQENSHQEIAPSRPAPPLRLDTSTIDHKQEDGDLSSVSDSVHYPPPALVSQASHPPSPTIIGGNIEPSRMEKTRSSSATNFHPVPDTPAVVPFTATSARDSSPLNRIPSSKLPDRLDVPSFTSPLRSSETTAVPPAPFWMHLDSSTHPPRAEGTKQPLHSTSTSSKKPLGAPSSYEDQLSVPIRRPVGQEEPQSLVTSSPVRWEADAKTTEKLRREVTELIQLNNALHEKIDALTESCQASERELHNERLLSQQRAEDLKTRHLLANEECRSLREENNRLKREVKEMIARQEEESLKQAAASTLPQQLDTYRQLSETLARENLKLSTDIAKLGKQSSEREGQEKKSVATIKLLLEKNVALEQEVAIFEQRLDHERRAKDEERQQREDLSEKLREVSNKYKRVETELRKLQSRVHEEVQSEVSVETERMLLLEEECDRLRKEIFASKSERDQWEIENIRLSQELSDIRAVLETSSPENLSELKEEKEELHSQLRVAESAILELKSQLRGKDSGWEQQREDLHAALLQSKADLKEAKKGFKQQLQAAEAKPIKMQSEILRLVSLSPLTSFLTIIEHGARRL